jgi:hypothetical protein
VGTVRRIQVPNPQGSRKRVPKPDRRRALNLLASCRERAMALAAGMTRKRQVYG